MKPYDGGAWRGVSRVAGPAELHAAYDASGEMLMHLQKAIDYDVFARSLSIGAETMVMRFQPDQPGASYGEKLAAYAGLADDYFESERYHDFRASRLAHIDEIVLDWVAGPDFDQLLIETVQSVYPDHEHDQFIAHLRGLTSLWVGDESARLRS
jgi:hypothetical protein